MTNHVFPWYPIFTHDPKSLAHPAAVLTRMVQFLGMHLNRLDAKGRVSVPASFRAALKEAEAGTVILRPAHHHACIEAWPLAAFNALAAPLRELDLFSEDHDDMAAALYADAHAAEADKDGRIMLPDDLALHAGLTDSVAFIGMGRIFHIWEPQAGAAFLAGARARMRNGGKTLRVAGG